MKLMPPAITQDLKAAEVARDVLRAQETAKILKETNINLAKAEAEFNDTLAKHRTIWAKEEAEHDARMAERKQELLLLEQQISALKEPIEAQKQEARRILFLAKEKQAKEDLREIENNELLERLESKLDSIGAREVDVKAREARLNNHEKGLEAQAEEIRAGGAALTEMMLAQRIAQEKKSQELDERAKAVALLERSLEERLLQLNLRATELDKKESAIIELQKDVDAKLVIIRTPIAQLEADARAIMQGAEKKEKQIKEKESQFLFDKQIWEEAKALHESGRMLKKTALAKQEEELKTESLALKKRESEIRQKEKLLANSERDIHEKELTLQMQEWEQEKACKSFAEEKLDFERLKANLEESIEKREAEANEKMREAKKMVDLAYAKERKLTDASQSHDAREKEVATAEAELATKLQGHAKKEAILQAQKEEFTAQKTDTFTKLEKREMEVESKRKLYSEKEKKIERQEKFLSDWAKRLKDEQAALARAKKEVMG